MSEHDPYAGVRAFLAAEVKRRGLSTAQVAELVGLRYFAVHRALRGQRPAILTLGRVANALGYRIGLAVIDGHSDAKEAANGLRRYTVPQRER